MKNKLCDYGCGKQANYMLKSGKMCCSKSYNSCDALRNKNSLALIKLYRSKKCCIWNKGLTKETNESLNKASNSLKQGYKIGKWKVLGYCSKEFRNSKRGKQMSRKGGLLGGRKGGLISASKQNRRSKNEAYFAEFCQKYFSDVECNKPIFNRWDADVIIHDFKVAVLWNGIWHYKKINKRHKLKQVISRDKIKIKQIIKCGYTPYIIKDMGKYNKNFVENEFVKFIKWLKDARLV